MNERIKTITALAVLLALLCACSNNNQPQNPAPPTEGKIKPFNNMQVVKPRQ